MFEVSFQDYRTYREFAHDPTPPVERETFATKDEADTRKKELQRIGLTACVTPLVIRTRRNLRGPTPIDGDGPRFNAAWKLAR